MNSAIKTTFFFCVRNIEGENHSEHAVSGDIMKVELLLIQKISNHHSFEQIEKFLSIFDFKKTIQPFDPRHQSNTGSAVKTNKSKSEGP